MWQCYLLADLATLSEPMYWSNIPWRLHGHILFVATFQISDHMSLPQVGRTWIVWSWAAHWAIQTASPQKTAYLSVQMYNAHSVPGLQSSYTFLLLHAKTEISNQLARRIEPWCCHKPQPNPSQFMCTSNSADRVRSNTQNDSQSVLTDGFPHTLLPDAVLVLYHRMP